MKNDPRRKGFENRVDIYRLANVILSALGVEPLDGSEWSVDELRKRPERVEILEIRSLLNRMLAKEPWLRLGADEVEKELIAIWKRFFTKR